MTLTTAMQKARQLAIKKNTETFVYHDEDGYEIGTEADADTYFYGQNPVAGFWPDGDSMERY